MINRCSFPATSLGASLQTSLASGATAMEFYIAPGGSDANPGAREGDLWAEGEDLRFTRTKDQRTIYAFALKWPGQKLLLRSVKPAKGSSIRMLGASEVLLWSQRTEGVEVRLPGELQDESRRPCRFAGAFEIHPESA